VSTLTGVVADIRGYQKALLWGFGIFATIIAATPVSQFCVWLWNAIFGA